VNVRKINYTLIFSSILIIMFVSSASAITQVVSLGSIGIQEDAITFDNSGSAGQDRKITSYDRDFGDGTTKTSTAAKTDSNSDADFTQKNIIAMDDEVNHYPIADPNGPYTGTEGREIIFDGSNSSDADGSIESYAWDFGDEATETGVNPTHTYAQNGTYTVTLNVTDDSGAVNTTTTTATIIDIDPLANFTGSPTSGPEPLKVVFTDNSTSYDGIAAWAWDFDNNGTVDSTAPNPTYEYIEEGTYTVLLRVFEEDGDNDTLIKENYITVSNVNKNPTANPNGPYTGTEGIEIILNGSNSSDADGSIGYYAWDFGDGTTGTGVNPAHIYAQNGTYSVTLTVTDDSGAPNTSTTTATIADTDPEANFTGSPASGSEPLTVVFTDDSTSYDGITAWAWDFNNDGTVDSTAPNPTYEYIDEGNYTVILTVSEEDGDTATMRTENYITVSSIIQPPVANLNGPYTGTEGIEITFGGSNSSDADGTIESYAWDFGDGTTGTGINPPHTYAQNGTYTVTLNVTDDSGAANTTTTTATIADTNPEANFTAANRIGMEPLSVVFTNTSISYDGITKWEWDFDNDGTVDSREENPTYKYTEEGVYTVLLTVFEEDGDTATMKKDDYINVSNVNKEPIADPNGPYTGTEGIPVTFNGTGSFDPDGSIVLYSWDFGDGNTETGASTTHIYVQNGTYNVSLTILDNQDSDGVNFTTATITDTNPVADFTGSPTTGPYPLTVVFTDDSTSYDGIDKWEWDFDNNGVIDNTTQNATHKYTLAGTYTVNLTVYEADGDHHTKIKKDYITTPEIKQETKTSKSGGGGGGGGGGTSGEK
jgi:PKD repeat protein